jgi:hypothetical protein
MTSPRSTAGLSVCLALIFGALLAGCAGSSSMEVAQDYRPAAGQKFAYEISSTAGLRQDERLALDEGLRRRLLSTGQLGVKGDASVQEVLIVVDTWVRATESTQFIEQMSTPAAKMSSAVRVQGTAGAAIAAFRVTTEPGVTRGARGGAAQHGDDIGAYLVGQRK